MDLRLYCLVRNLKTEDKELDFGDFKIVSVQQGPEAAKWRKKLECKEVPRVILIKEFRNYEMDDEDVSGFDKIIQSVDQLLLILRLFKSGDVMFCDHMIEDLVSKERALSLYTLGKPSFFNYDFGQDEITNFNDFRKLITNKPGFNNPFYRFALDHFMTGVNKGFRYKIKELERIVDYITALESMFLIDNEPYFLRSTLGRRVSRLLEDDETAKIIKSLYDERSNIVHGGNIGLSAEKEIRKLERIRSLMPSFEDIIRKAFVKLLEHNFSHKDEMIEFMKSLYSMQGKSLKIMQSASAEAQKYL